VYLSNLRVYVLPVIILLFMQMGWGEDGSDPEPLEVVLEANLECDCLTGSMRWPESFGDPHRDRSKAFLDDGDACWMIFKAAITELDLTVVFDLDNGTATAQVEGRAYWHRETNAGCSSQYGCGLDEVLCEGSFGGITYFALRPYDLYRTWEFNGSIPLSLKFHAKGVCQPTSQGGESHVIERTESVEVRGIIKGMLKWLENPPDPSRPYTADIGIFLPTLKHPFSLSISSYASGTNMEKAISVTKWAQDNDSIPTETESLNIVLDLGEQFESDMGKLNMGDVNFDISVAPGLSDVSVEPGTLVARIDLCSGTRVMAGADYILDLGKTQCRIEGSQLSGIEDFLEEDDPNIKLEVLQTQGSFKMIIRASCDGRGVFAARSRAAIDAEADYRIESVELRVRNLAVNLKSSVLVRFEDDGTCVYSLDGTPEVELPDGTIIPLEAGYSVTVDAEGITRTHESFSQDSLDAWWETPIPEPPLLPLILCLIILPRLLRRKEAQA
jgi:hypothetical protein